MKSSIKVKSGVFLGTLLLFTISILSILVLEGIKRNQQKQYEDFLFHQSKIANIYVRQSYLTESIEDKKEFLNKKGQVLASQLSTMSEMNVILYDMSGKEIGNSALFPDEINISDTLNYALENKIAYQVVGESLDYLAPLNDLDKQIGVVQFQYSLKESIKFYEDIKNLFIGTGIITLILSFIIGYFYYNILAEGILKLKKAVEKIRDGKYNEAEILKRNDELGELSKGIYFMSSKIDQNIKDMEEEQEKLRLAVEKLRLLGEQQKNFIGNITHEFKTPLTVIKAYIDLIDMYSDDPNLIEEAKVNIGKETQRLYDMVEKILRLASLEKYDFEFKAEKIEVNQVLNEICNRMKGKAQKFGLSLYTELKPAAILVDKESFMQIFINLLDNAIKYNKPEGEIFVKNYIENEVVCIEVKDTGVGIPKEAGEKVFEPFYRVDRDRSRQTGGNGLGLAIVKELVEKQQGNIKLLHSGKSGTSFLISFPLLNTQNV
ncbi:sensor histidine kinase [Clostridium ganghwense]|uniref:histidine kinase n=1 Tax=Clostridium ganghwense TaxID=312089 RepID=A0ABT4CMX8_9CLOT|nr:HAMP domain-containing sensor histidine kinase [Clostridium ganghwense]MCY6369451.1 HAMP domain-containing sensor histidine kinase [Clostridium ganghwense]